MIGAMQAFRKTLTCFADIAVATGEKAEVVWNAWGLASTPDRC